MVSPAEFLKFVLSAAVGASVTLIGPLEIDWDYVLSAECDFAHITHDPATCVTLDGEFAPHRRW